MTFPDPWLCPGFARWPIIAKTFPKVLRVRLFGHPSLTPQSRYESWAHWGSAGCFLSRFCPGWVTSTNVIPRSLGPFPQGQAVAKPSTVGLCPGTAHTMHVLRHVPFYPPPPPLAIPRMYTTSPQPCRNTDSLLFATLFPVSIPISKHSKQSGNIYSKSK